MTPAKMVEDYIRLRDYKKNAEDEFNKSMEKVNLGMEKLEAMLLQHLQETGAKSLACEVGTVYRNVRFSATVEDKQTFRDWVLANDEWEAIDLKANKTFVRDAVDEGREVPGVKHSSVYTVGVRRAS